MDIAAIILHTFLFISLYIEVFFLVTFFEHKTLRQTTALPSGKALPRVSIIVPCYNEERTLAATVESILGLSYPKEKLSVVIVNDGSTDNTFTVARSFENNAQVQVLTKENGGKHTALNLGIQYTNADIIGCLDADSFVSPEALRRIVSVFEENDVYAVTPSIKVHNPKGIIPLMQKVEYEVGVFIRHIFGLLDAQYVTPGPFSLYRKEVFEELGGFREAFQTEDLEMALRIQESGKRIKNISNAYVFTVVPQTVYGLYRQRLRWVSGFLNNALRNYRHLIFNAKYGNLGMFSLPGAIFGVLMALYGITYMFITATQFIVDHISQIGIVGISGTFAHMNWFFVNTGSATLLALILLGATVLLVIIGKSLSSESLNFSSDLMYFIFIYGLIAPFWLAKAVYQTAFPNNLTWK